MNTTSPIKIIEVGPRDGLQNETPPLPTALKIEFVDRLSMTGLSRIEVSSFVHPDRVPQLADAEALFAGIQRLPNRHYTALTPNSKGFERALASRTDGVAVFTAVSETFCQRNIQCGIDESLERFKPVISAAKQKKIPVRAYISCALGCPYEGYIAPSAGAKLAARLIELGCDEISLGDTIGAGTPLSTQRLLDEALAALPAQQLAVHFHDTRGLALANILRSLEMGIFTIDASVAGLGGCPYAPGASGNVATEDVVFMLEGMGIKTGVNLEMLIEIGAFICAALGRRNNSRVALAGLPARYESYRS